MLINLKYEIRHPNCGTKTFKYSFGRKAIVLKTLSDNSIVEIICFDYKSDTPVKLMAKVTGLVYIENITDSEGRLDTDLLIEKCDSCVRSLI